MSLFMQLAATLGRSAIKIRNAIAPIWQTSHLAFSRSLLNVFSGVLKGPCNKFDFLHPKISDYNGSYIHEQ